MSNRTIITILTPFLGSSLLLFKLSRSTSALVVNTGHVEYKAHCLNKELRTKKKHNVPVRAPACSYNSYREIPLISSTSRGIQLFKTTTDKAIIGMLT